MSSLDGKVAIVSGSGRGIGRAMALKLASEGAAVVINDIDEAPAAEAKAAIEAIGGRATTVVGDVTAADFGDRFVGAALNEFGRLDIVINNAGYALDNLMQKADSDQFEAMLDVHAAAPFRILKAAFPHFREQARIEAENGQEIFRKVVNISSIVALAGNPGQVSYSAGKAAIIGMTRTLAKEWGRYKVNVNAIAYGVIQTRIVQPVAGDKPAVKIGDREIAMGIPEKLHQAISAQIPIGRWGTPEEAANAAYLFCTPESNFISGQVITVAGGATG
ncbi:SDR family NAD(P)-dependent oxidoreductase [Rhizorhabdus dicambivorans]|uniref:3-oxoacyl-ACP reductase n=1 Tax=Rhizorhabdus dicambivorans TaxID=1850238 RepID=A0A2A4FWA0_9SPHN|nr:SDR family oxidoreductase [Rhizorhabdus dicambivorans]ATE67444.1 3-oxoacyl-ACP reductase [Rhizorhabdus dicambivorans]PCE41718.1 3-oxoacyl-ACP reductase [Rhizorhabdus dicambivorans]